MQRPAEPLTDRRSDPSWLAYSVLVFILIVAGYLRFTDLGERSLWLDEFCTWHVSRLPLGESLQWEPELTIPPLYQLTLRATTHEPRPPEWRLRLPAAVCGLLLIGAGWWLGTVVCHWSVGCALAALLACDFLQIEYSREARPYSMLVLGGTLSTLFWYRLVTQPKRRYVLAYVVATVLTIHAHFLVMLAVGGHVIWWLLTRRRRRTNRPTRHAIVSLGVTILLSLPVLLRSFWHREIVAGDISWIGPTGWVEMANVLIDVAFGPFWVALMLVPAVAIWVLAAFRHHGLGWARQAYAGRDDVCGLLLAWLLCAWLGLGVLSWLVQPVMVTRYALPTAVPAVLLPLIVGYRLRRWLPAIPALVFCLGALWWGHATRVDSPGFRELVQYVERNSVADDTLVALVIGHSANPHWPEMQRLTLDYYPMKDREVHQIHLDAEGRPIDGSIFEDPRPMYLIAFRSEPFALLENVGRESEPILFDGDWCPQLFFAPYRLLRVAPMERASE